MAATLELIATAIIAVGDFNPAICTPDWLERQNLIGSTDADLARASDGFEITKEVARFETDWFILQVVKNQLSLTSKGATLPAVKDLAFSIFSLLPHTPVSAVGLNFMAHYKLDTDEYYKLGDILAPKALWNELCNDGESAGLETLAIRIDPFERGAAPTNGNHKRIHLQPSSVVKNAVLLAFNDHHQITPSSDANQEHVTEIIEKYWQSDWDMSISHFNKILDLALRS